MCLRNKTTAMAMTAKAIPAAAAPPTMSGKLSPVSNKKKSQLDTLLAYTTVHRKLLVSHYNIKS